MLEYTPRTHIYKLYLPNNNNIREREMDLFTSAAIANKSFDESVL